MPNPLFNILIHSKNKTYRELLADAICQQYKDTCKVVIGSSFNEALICLDNEHIDFFLFYLPRTTQDPFDFVEILSEEYSKTKIIILTLIDNPVYKRKLIKAGAANCYLLGQNIEILFEKIENMPRNLSTQLGG